MAGEPGGRRVDAGIGGDLGGQGRCRCGGAERGHPGLRVAGELPVPGRGRRTACATSQRSAARSTTTAAAAPAQGSHAGRSGFGGEQGCVGGNGQAGGAGADDDHESPASSMSSPRRARTVRLRRAGRLGFIGGFGRGRRARVAVGPGPVRRQPGGSRARYAPCRRARLVVQWSAAVTRMVRAPTLTRAVVMPSARRACAARSRARPLRATPATAPPSCAARGSTSGAPGNTAQSRSTAEQCEQRTGGQHRRVGERDAAAARSRASKASNGVSPATICTHDTTTSADTTEQYQARRTVPGGSGGAGGSSDDPRRGGGQRQGDDGDVETTFLPASRSTRSATWRRTRSATARTGAG